MCSLNHLLRVPQQASTSSLYCLGNVVNDDMAGLRVQISKRLFITS